MKWTQPAKLDLRQIHDYIARDSRFFAKKFSREIVQRSKQLSDFPEQGRMVPELGSPAEREVFVYSYRLIYQASPGRIEVLAVLHGRRLFPSEIGNR